MSALETAGINMATEILGPSLARGQGDDPAILCGDEIVTYAQLDARANAAGNAVRELGVGTGDRVLMMVRDTPAFIYVYLGLLKIGAVPVGLNLRLSPGDVAYTIDDSDCRAFVLDGMFLDLWWEGAPQAINTPQVIVTDTEEEGLLHLPSLMADASTNLAPVDLQPDDVSLWMYSSGTTGKPKGVVHAQRTIYVAEHLMGGLLGVGPGDKVYGTSKLFFAFSLAHCFLSTLRLGATVVLHPDWPDAELVTSIVERYEPTIMLSVPTFYRNLLRSGAAEMPAFKNVRYYMTAGEKMPQSLFDQWIGATGRPALEGIGATETCFLFLANRPDKIKAGTCGVPTPGTEVKIIDLDGNEVSEPKTPGVLWVKMDSVANGYWQLDERTEAVFKDGWYCTNDMFIIDDDGMYEHQGRSDDMLKISGQWVSPAEIEEQVMLHPKVSEAAVIGIPNEDGLIRLALFLVAPELGEDKGAFEAELQQQLIQALSIYKCPRQMHYVDAMPLTATGKLQRFKLKEMVSGDGA
jgi:benzoate-CoA ligase family protein